MLTRLVVMEFLTVAILAGCACGQMGQPVCPTLSVTSNPNSLTISGSLYSNVQNCSQISISGLPAPFAVLKVGLPQCANGSFSFNWPYSYVGCTPTDMRQVVIAGIDTQTSVSASQTIMFPYGNGCGLAGYCGQIGQPICPGSTACFAGVNSGGTCEACGGEGQPVCAGNTCAQAMPDLHPNLQGGEVVCTASCGHTQGAPCSNGYPWCGGQPPVFQSPQSPCVTQNAGLNDYTCYDHSMIDTFGNCTCVPNTFNSCQVDSSVPKPPANDQGTCTHVPNGSGWSNC